MSFQQIREYNDARVMTRSGYVWNEPKARFLISFWASVIVAVLGVLGSVVWLMMGKGIEHLYAVILLAAFVSAPFLVMRAGNRYGYRQRAIIFQAEGSILAPYGLIHHRKLKAIELAARDVSSIEKDKNQFWSVKIYFRNGMSIGVAAGALSSDESHMVAVQLNLALQDLRAARSSGAMQRVAINIDEL